MVFPNLVTPDALAAAKTFIEDREKRMAEAEEDQIPGTGEVKIGLVMDTLKMAGRGGDPENVMQPAHITAIDELCAAVAKCKNRYDHFGVWQQAFAEFGSRPSAEDAAAKEKEFR